MAYSLPKPKFLSDSRLQGEIEARLLVPGFVEKGEARDLLLSVLIELQQARQELNSYRQAHS